MELKTTGSVLEILGNIKSVEHFQEIKSVLDKMKQNHTRITLKIPTSFSMTSSVIGYLMKLVHKDNIDLSILAGDIRLINLLKDLGLDTDFKITKA